jgi:hypothetical protein
VPLPSPPVPHHTHSTRPYQIRVSTQNFLPRAFPFATFFLLFFPTLLLARSPSTSALANSPPLIAAYLLGFSRRIQCSRAQILAYDRFHLLPPPSIPCIRCIRCIPRDNDTHASAAQRRSPSSRQHLSAAFPKAFKIYAATSCLFLTEPPWKYILHLEALLCRGSNGMLIFVTNTVLGEPLRPRAGCIQ